MKVSLNRPRGRDVGTFPLGKYARGKACDSERPGVTMSSTRQSRQAGKQAGRQAGGGGGGGVYY